MSRICGGEQDQIVYIRRREGGSTSRTKCIGQMKSIGVSRTREE
jgi:hypothetical protein